MPNFLTRIFGSANERTLRRLWPIVHDINDLEAKLQDLPAEAFPEKTAEFRADLADEKVTPDDILPEAFAYVREAARRTIGLRHFDVQLLGGIVLHQGKIAEMKTGEGKTLVEAHLARPGQRRLRAGAGHSNRRDRADAADLHRYGRAGEQFGDCLLGRRHHGRYGHHRLHPDA